MRFTIRDLLWLVALVAVLVAWWIERGRSARMASRAEAFAGALRWDGFEISDNRDHVVIHRPPEGPQYVDSVVP
jgi:hypothetical protein